MTNRDWLATLSDEDFYDSFKRVEKTEGGVVYRHPTVYD